ncbi:hypothetical protein ACIQ2D_17275 [Lysinibacillus sp. NPDC097287]|uniref:hypothetical protein n=1 Tax=Lysinibacillus sp. NPDC097287 TaxID=3364144 RepID=UPI0038128A72
MRFIKKSDIKNLLEISKEFKEIELHTNRSDFEHDKENENLEIIKQAFDENKAMITVIHSPASKFGTSLDKEGSLNYMSLSEVLSDLEEQHLFQKICKFANEIAKYYSGLTRSTTSNLSETEDREARLDKKIIDNKILIILHTGCVYGCVDNPKFNCVLRNQSRELICGTFTKDKEIDLFVNIVEGFPGIKIGFENITPYTDGGKLGSNCGYSYENFSLAKECNSRSKKKEKNLFGVVIDFCHLIATHTLTDSKKNKGDFLREYFEQLECHEKQLIQLFHLSNYKMGPTGEQLHGEQFEIQEDIDEIRSICLNNARSVPITLEVSGSDRVANGIENFYKMMLDWSKLHILLKDCLEDELYIFFENLFYIYSTEYNANKLKFTRISNELKRYIVKNSSLEKKLFGITSDEQSLNINLFQVQAYIQYMRYCNLALDLKEKYKGNISTIFKHYIFNDKYEEIRFDGIGYYYNIFWIKREVNLYRCNDGISPLKIVYYNFEDILKACKKHIQGENLQFLSYSKSFGRNMLKYFNPNSDGYNIEIVEKSPINFFTSVCNSKETSIQEYIGSDFEYSNFSIDFSDFCGKRGDSTKEGSLFELFEKIEVDSNKLWKEKIGSIYDHEVIFYDEPYRYEKRKQYKLNIAEYKILMLAYQILLIDNNHKEFNLSYLINYLILNQNETFLTYMDLESLNTVKERDSIIEILSSIDYNNEPDIKYSNEGYSPFSKEFIPEYQEFVSNKLGTLISNYREELKGATKWLQ